MSLTVLLGGARSGKTRLALHLAAGWDGPVVYVATAEPGDAEMAARVAMHREERPAHWTTVEEPVALQEALAGVPADACVVIDCLSLWLSNLLEAGTSPASCEYAAHAAATAAARRIAPTFAVTNEVGLGIVPATPLGRVYRDLLGRVNQIWVEASAAAALVVAGRPVRLEDADWLLEGDGGR